MPPQLRLWPVFTSTRTRTQTLVGVAVLAATVAVVSVLFQRAFPGFTDPVWLRSRIEEYGRLAPLVFVLLQATQIVLAPVPGQLVAFVGGYLFGVLHGTIYSIVGTALGSTVAFLIARRYGRPYVRRVIAADTLSAFDEIVAREGQFALFLVFLVPGLPDDAICFMAGITRLPLWKLVTISVVGRVPGYLLVCYAGSQFATANYLGTTVILGLFAFVSILVYWRKDALLARIR